MSIYSCFQDVIGISRKADICTDTTAYISESGLYLDELQGISLRILDAAGGNTSLLEKMANAKENAINAFKVDVIQKILETKEPARPKFVGDIGTKPFTSLLAGSTYQGIRIFSDIYGGSYTLRGVSFIFNATENVTLRIYKGQDYELEDVALHTITTNSVGGNLTSLGGHIKFNAITPIQLPLDGDYYFLYSTPLGAVPYNNNLGCNCGGYKWCFNTQRPCYNKSRDNWTEWAMAGGVYGTDLSIRADWPTSREARGLILHGDFGCDTIGILCDEHSDWAGNEVDAAIAWAILFKAGAFLSGYIMDSEEVNRYTLLGIDSLTANMIYYEERYKVMIDFIGTNIELNRNECLKCRSPHGYGRNAQML